VLKKGKVYVPKDERLRTEVIWLHHDMPTAEHGGKWKTVELVARSDKGGREICRGIQSVLENEEQDRRNGGETKVK